MLARGGPSLKSLRANRNLGEAQGTRGCCSEVVNLVDAIGNSIYIHCRMQYGITVACVCVALFAHARGAPVLGLDLPREIVMDTNKA